MTVQEAKEFISTRLHNVGNRGFAPIENVLRTICFCSDISDEVWEKVIIPEIMRQYPEIKK
jgi:hypothetical protein